MERILHQLRLVVDPIIYRVLYIPGGCLGISSINSMASRRVPLVTIPPPLWSSWPARPQELQCWRWHRLECKKPWKIQPTNQSRGCQKMSKTTKKMWKMCMGFSTGVFKVISHKLCRQRYKRNTWSYRFSFKDSSDIPGTFMARSYQGRMAWMPSLRMAAWRRLLNLRFARQRCWGYQQPGAQDCPSGAKTRSNVRLPPMFWCFGIPRFGQGQVSWARATRHHLANGFFPKSIHAVKGLGA